jgi:DNA-binding response OmpR family regulator
MRILVVEDERQLAEIIGKVLEREHYSAELAFEGDTGYDLALSGTYDAIILDRMLPGMDGLVLCRHRRDAGIDTPVLILSARRDMDERVAGLDSGADDYLGKPFAFKELLARVRALTRRREREILPGVLRAGGIGLDQQSRRVTLGDTEVELSPREFALLEYLMRNAGQVLEREQILERVWGYDSDAQEGVVDLYIHYLRRKLARNGYSAPIETVRGIGYRIRR